MIIQKNREAFDMNTERHNIGDLTSLDVLKILLKRVKLILLFLVIGGCLSAGVSVFMITPKYHSTTSLLVQPSEVEGRSQTNDVNDNILTVSTYKDWILTNDILANVSKKIKDDHYNYSSRDLKKMIVVDQSENSQLFSVLVTTDNAEKSRDIANVVANVFVNKANEILKTDEVSIISEAVLDDRKISPNNTANTMLGGLFGMIIGICSALVIELAKNPKKTS